MNDHTFKNASRENTFASFAVVRSEQGVWAVEPKDMDRKSYLKGMNIFSEAPFLMPGGILETGYSPLDSCRLVSAMQGLDLKGEGRQISVMKVEGQLVRFFEFESAARIAPHKLSRMTKEYDYAPTQVALDTMANLGYTFLKPVQLPNSIFHTAFFSRA